jgi:hypothetical protein
MSEAANARNGYRCQTCGYLLVTINRQEGVTPFSLGACRNPSNVDGCPGRMYSLFYRLPPNAPEPTWEWYSPSKGERQYRRLSDWERDHVERGGLLLRKIEVAA